MARGLLWLIVAAALSTTVNGHALFVSPAPRYDGVDKLKAWPCGEGLTDQWTGTATSIKPGALEVVFRETVNHNGAP
jgi:hypothetical protein